MLFFFLWSFFSFTNDFLFYRDYDYNEWLPSHTLPLRTATMSHHGHYHINAVTPTSTATASTSTRRQWLHQHTHNHPGPPPCQPLSPSTSTHPPTQHFRGLAKLYHRLSGVLCRLPIMIWIHSRRGYQSGTPNFCYSIKHLSHFLLLRNLVSHCCPGLKILMLSSTAS